VTRRRLLAIALVVVVASAAGLAALAAYLVSARQDRILAAVGRELGRPFRADHLGVSLRGGVGVALHDVVIGEDPAVESKDSFLTASLVAMRLRILPLLRRRLVVDSVLVDDPVVNLVRNADGRLNVETLGGRGTKPGAAADPAGEGSSLPSAPPAFQIASLRLRRGVIRYVERATGRAFELRDVAVDAREPRFAAPVPIAVRAELAGKDLRLDDIVSEGVLDLASTPPAYNGTFHAGPGALGKLPLERITATMRAKAPDVTLDSATLDILGGEVTGNAALTSAGAGVAVRAQVAGTGLDISRLPTRHDRPHPAGTLVFDGSFSGTGELPKALTGTGKFRVVDGRLVGATLGPAILDILAPVLGRGDADHLRTRYPDLFGDEGLRFTALSGSGRLKDSIISSDDLVLAGTSYDARGAGSLGLDGDVDMELRLSASSALTDDLFSHAKKARPILVGADGRLMIPLHVHGAIDHPHVSPEPEFAGRVARGLLGGTGLEEAAGTLIEEFFGKRKKKGK
jgi:hypothetical protein